MMKRSESRFTIPSEMDYIPLVALYARQLAASLGFPGEDASKIELAVSEACTNVVRHAYLPEEEEFFTVIFNCLPNLLEIVIEERGIPFEPRNIGPFSYREDMEEHEMRGMGLHLIHRCMDDVRFVNKGPQGKELRLIKYLPPEKQAAPEETIEEFVPTLEAIEAGPAEYELRLMNPGEALEVTRCTYLTYGYSYPMDELYYPDTIEEMNRRGEMFTVVALDRGARIIGHTSLLPLFRGSPAAEILQPVVIPSFSSKGLVEGMILFLVSHGMKEGLEGLYLQANTHELAPQEMACSLSFKECALLLDCTPAPSLLTEKAKGPPKERTSSLISFRNLTSGDDEHALHLPAEHAAFVERIYSHLGMRRSLFEGPEPGPTQNRGESSLVTRAFPSLGLTSVTVMEYGKDVESRIQQILEELPEEILTIQLNLRLRDPFTAYYCKAFESLGFFFAGVIPIYLEGDAIVLQYLPGFRPDLTSFELYSEASRELFTYILHRRCGTVRSM